MQRFPVTKQGFEALKKELLELETVKRPNVVQAIAEARAHGDLKENAEYHAAKEEQGFIEGRIRDLKAKVSGAQVIDVTQIPHTGKVIFGTTVELLNIDTDKTVTYQLVSEDEADFKQGKISINSPIARAMIGKEEGEEILVKTPGGEVEYEIIEVKHL